MEKSKEHLTDGWRKCEVCGSNFHPTPDWVYKSKKTGHLVCRYNCMLKTEKEKGARMSKLLQARDLK